MGSRSLLAPRPAAVDSDRSYRIAPRLERTPPHDDRLRHRSLGHPIRGRRAAGAPAGWLIADTRPDLVKAIVAAEPLGPPFKAINGPMPYGITHAPLTFDPPLAAGENLEALDVPSPGEGLVAYKIQAEPARQLPALSQMPIVVVTAEASWMAGDNHAMVHFLKQAGANVEHLRLENAGIHGNGHAIQLEKNSDDIAALIANWLSDRLEL